MVWRVTSIHFQACYLQNKLTWPPTWVHKAVATSCNLSISGNLKLTWKIDRQLWVAGGHGGLHQFIFRHVISKIYWLDPPWHQATLSCLSKSLDDSPTPKIDRLPGPCPNIYYMSEATPSCRGSGNLHFETSFISEATPSCRGSGTDTHTHTPKHAHFWGNSQLPRIWDTKHAHFWGNSQLPRMGTQNMPIS